ncbi:hypothetical protein VE01_10738 [Pseudogymnoascus verrucosus]|uniref:CENP-V/GFA domain-containing protein n=1 Tax=Pseudogymnoascus verrucosus TaxID=342668 RepID=A0A2P6FGS5_9PEZI|nr:uncharacterized protein VE01_10738 [Pseudogymnoascus verrucosus]PQM43842.1 hypothetical protein VE01_10738 [Pseudogymnoascus verrucosus]
MASLPPLQGHCNCGGIVVTVRQPKLPVNVSLCHCLDCRASGGTLFQVNLIVPSSNVGLSGELIPSVYSTEAASGNHSNRHFCPRCGSPICTTVTENPSITFVKGGLFGNSEQGLQRPFKEQWWRRAEAWEKPYVPVENKIF